MVTDPGFSVRVKLGLSGAALAVLGSASVLVVAWLSGVRDVRTFVLTAAGLLALMVLVGLAGGWMLGGHIQAPLVRVIDAARLAAGGALSHRVGLHGRRDELGELAAAFDVMLARLDAHVDEQRRFAANVSHELRTPLAVAQSLLDVARLDPHRDPAALVERLQSVNARAIDLTKALLTLGRAEQRAFVREHVDLSLVAEEAAETLLPLAERSGLRIEISGGHAPTYGSYTLLLQLTLNLVHNAIVHNVPGCGTVEIGTSVHTGLATLTVENPGERLAPELVPMLTVPFQRGTERTRGDHAGVGLGLAIVKSIAEAHDGSVALVPRASGGLTVTVRLPVHAGHSLTPTICAGSYHQHHAGAGGRGRAAHGGGDP